MPQPGTEEKARYVFIKTLEDPQNGWRAMIADRGVLGDDGISSLQNASKMSAAFNAIRIRHGVTMMNADQLAERLAVMAQEGLQMSVEQLTNAKGWVDRKNGIADPRQQAAPAAFVAPQRA
jgi:hypothetical protein